jgi:hypothetical protein
MQVVEVQSSQLAEHAEQLCPTEYVPMGHLSKHELLYSRLELSLHAVQLVAM